MLIFFILLEIFIYFLLLLSIIAITVIMERLFFFTKTDISLRSEKSLSILIEQKNFVQLKKHTANSKTPTGIVINKLVNEYYNINKTKQLEVRKILENKASIEGSKQIKIISKYTHLLELVGKIAPMTGLAGTVIGLTSTFQTLSTAGNLSNSSLLAGGIYEALTTTVSGLVIAIPSLVFHHIFANKIKSYIFSMKHISEELIEKLENLS